MPSIQGYTSIVDGRYASATGSHEATGEGDATLAPQAIEDGTLDQLDTSVLLTLSAYLITEAGAGGPGAGPPGTGQRDIAIDQRATWYLGTSLEVSKVEVPDADARQDAAAGTQIGLMAPDGSTNWFHARAITPSTLAITLPRPVPSTAVLGQAHGTPCSLGPPSIVAADGSAFVADGQLQDALVPSHWEFTGFDGSFAVFGNRFAQGQLRIESLQGRPSAHAWIREVSGAPAEPTAATVFSPHGARVVRSVAAIPGWSATWQPRHGTGDHTDRPAGRYRPSRRRPARTGGPHLELYTAAPSGRHGPVARGDSARLSLLPGGSAGRPASSPGTRLLGVRVISRRVSVGMSATPRRREVTTPLQQRPAPEPGAAR